jgi:[acyl-carrier-protein] S-malonyltransferase
VSGCAFLFPGQGAQVVGMGQELVATYPEARDLLERAEAQTHLPLRQVMGNGPQERLNADFMAQVAVYTVSCMVSEVLETRGIRAMAIAPYSSGIYAAAYAAGAIEFEAGLTLMREADRCIRRHGNGGTMGAVLGLAVADVEKLYAQVDGVVEVSIINTHHQVIVSGESFAVVDLLQQAEAAGALKTTRLPAAAPYHCGLLASADQCLARRVAQTPLADPHTPIISYLDGAALTSAPELAGLLSCQLSSRVDWVAVVESLVRRGLARMVEIGPGQMLSRCVRWIHRRATVFNTETALALETAVDTLQAFSD